MLSAMLPVALTTALLLGATSTPPPNWFDVTCEKGSTTAGCTAAAGTGAHHSKKQGTEKAKTSGTKAQSSASRTCKDITGQAIPCSDPVYGTAGNDGCYYKPTTVTPAQAAAFGGAGDGPGSWFIQSCFGTPGTGGGILWRPTGDGPQAVPTVPVEDVARMAVDKLKLSSPVIAASPAVDEEQLATLPTWLWVRQWKAQSATATVPGVSVTVTATPKTVTWSMGDGSTEVCQGAGTQFPAGRGDSSAITQARAASPDCGHTYTESSAGQPGSAFPVTATISWSVTWAGGNNQNPNQRGALPALESTSTAAFQVAESQTLLSAGAQ